MSSIKLTVGGLQPRHSKGDTVPVVPAAVTGIWLFNRAPGASDAEALAAGRRNRLPGASNGPDDNIFPFDLPEVHTDYWRFSHTTPLLTRVPHTEEMTLLIFCRTLGAIATGPAYIAGTFGNTLVGGMGIEYNSATNVRMLAYDDANPDEVKTNQIGGVGDTHDKWRLFKADLTDADFGLVNKTGDMASNGGARTALPNGNAIGQQSLSIGGRIGSSIPYTNGVDIAMVVSTAGQWNVGDDAAMLGQARRQIALTGLTEGVA